MYFAIANPKLNSEPIHGKNLPNFINVLPTVIPAVLITFMSDPPTFIILPKVFEALIAFTAPPKNFVTLPITFITGASPFAITPTVLVKNFPTACITFITGLNQIFALSSILRPNCEISLINCESHAAAATPSARSSILSHGFFDPAVAITSDFCISPTLPIDAAFVDLSLLASGPGFRTSFIIPKIFLYLVISGDVRFGLTLSAGASLRIPLLVTLDLPLSAPSISANGFVESSATNIFNQQTGS